MHLSVFVGSFATVATLVSLDLRVLISNALFELVTTTEIFLPFTQVIDSFSNLTVSSAAVELLLTVTSSLAVAPFSEV